MTDWLKIYETDCGLPPGRRLDDLVAELAEALRDPDPEVRDGYPYAVLDTWIRRGVIDHDRRLALGDLMAERFGDPQIQARTFAPLVLAMIVSQGSLRPEWLDAFAAWYRAETDLRGRDDTLGWLHAVAHGADLLAAFGLRPEVDPEPLLVLATERLLAPTDHLFAEREDDRLAKAIALTLIRPDLTAERSTAWLSAIGTALAPYERGPMPVWASNTVRTLRALYVTADLGVSAERGGRPVPLAHGDAVKGRLAEVLRLVFPFA
ncbi:DUF2785 domain-containing protein [Streptomyces sp. FH025]|uniref:DUF2785 domain-containing protein n=1 Tax=Streptomyces sp. FH025 TaxID=2815937 RepID=UPI001A9EF4CC|nr:DUF2785 domain-containing protein [Streptomyces sp. FH025]MBO1415121.1 DUF2785 domain-containing protein [Streptomyces sp. FH025]